MKKQIIAILCIAFVWVGCKENNSSVDFGHTGISDTTYVLATTSIPALQPHNVLADEFTGQSCANCPQAAGILETASNTNPNRVNIISRYFYSGGSAYSPVGGSIHDLRDSLDILVDDQIYAGIAATSIPGGGIDRTPISGSMYTAKEAWTTAIINQLTIVDSVNIDVSTSYNAVTNLDTIVVKVTYVYGIATPQNLSVEVVEDSIYDKQLSSTDTIPNYLFMNVFRGSVTPEPTGTPIGTDRPIKEQGRVYQKVFTYTPKTITPAIIPKHCRVVAYVNNPGTGGDYRVIQSVQAPLRH